MRRRIGTAVCIAAVFAFACTAVSTEVFGERLSGSNRYETSVKISQSGWTSSKNVVIASGEDFADALCAVPLAKKLNAPIILTGSKNIEDCAVKEISRLGAVKVYIAGGKAAVSDSVKDTIEKALKINDTDIKRLSGADRYETSVAIAKEVGVNNGIVIAYGGGFADALSVAPIAAAKGMPILLTAKENLSDSIGNYIESEKSNIKNAYIIGGTGVIDNSVAAKVDSLTGITNKRLSGADRYETNINVLKEFENDNSISFNNVFMAVGDGPTGNEFADALSGAVLAAKRNAPLILTYKSIPEVSKNYLDKKVSKDTVTVALGGVGVLPENIVNQVQTIISKASNSNSNSNGTGNSTTSGAISGGTASSGGGSSAGGGPISKDPNSGNAGDNKPQTIIYGKNPLTVSVTGNNVVATYTGGSASDVTIQVFIEGNLKDVKFMDQCESKNGGFQFSTVLDKGTYVGYIKTSSGLINLPEFTVK